MEDTVTKVLSSWVYTCINSYTYIHADAHTHEKDIERDTNMYKQRYTDKDLDHTGTR